VHDKDLTIGRRAVVHSVQVAQLRLIALTIDVAAHQLKGHPLQLPVDHAVLVRHLMSQLPADEALVTQAAAIHALLQPLTSGQDSGRTSTLLNMLHHPGSSESICSCIVSHLIEQARPDVALKGMTEALTRFHPGSELLQQLCSIKVCAECHAQVRA
jgi:hypothetical protein